MKIVIEGTPEEVAEAIRRLAGPQDIKPILAPERQRIDPSIMPLIPYEPPHTVPSQRWEVWPWGTQITSDGVQFTYTT